MEFGYEYFQKTRGAREAILIQLLTTLLYPEISEANYL